MRKNPFLIFLIVISLLVGGLVLFIQSRTFTRILKNVAERYVPTDLGIEGDLSELQVKLFPPGISLKKPQIKLKERNILDLPGDTRIEAEQMDLIFLPFQMFSGNIRINKVVISGGEIYLNLDKKFLSKKQKGTRSKSNLSFHWDELFQIHAEAVALENTHLKFSMAQPSLNVDLIAESVNLGQWSGKGGLGYELEVKIRDIHSQTPKEWGAPSDLDRLEVKAKMNAVGMQLEDFKLVRKQVELAASGNVKGNILNPKELPADAKVKFSGQISELFPLVLSRFFPKQTGPLPTGFIGFEGKIKTNLENPSSALKAEGVLRAQDLNWKAWKAEQLQLEGGWNGTSTGGEVVVTKALISSPWVNRVGGSQPGSGGKVEVGAFKYKTNVRDEVVVPVKLEDAHIHWLTPMAIKEVYPLDLRVSGNLEAHFMPALGKLPWDLKSKLDLQVKNFQLDNQRWSKVKPLHRILKVPSIKVQGEVSANPDRVSLTGLGVSISKTQFQLSGGIDFKNGYDLKANGPVKLEEIGEIAENTIRGDGTLSVHVYGPSSRAYIDFDADLKDAYYLHLKLGKLNGRITWDDDPQFLFFKDVKLLQGKTNLLANGKLDLSDADTVALDIKVGTGSIQDLNFLFEEFTNDFWWFPKRLTGSTQGQIQVRGGISLDSLMVTGKLIGSEWEYFGERFKEVSLSGGYDKGKYFVDAAQALKRNGKLTAQISYSKDTKIDWNFATENISVSDIDHLARLDVPIRGNIGIASSGSGKTGAVESSTSVRVSDVVVRGVPFPASDLSIRSAGGITVAKGYALGGQGVLDFSYDFKTGGNCYLKTELNRLDFSPGLLILNPTTLQDRNLLGVASGLFELSFKSGEMDQGNGRIEVNEYHLAKTGTRFDLKKSVQTKIERGTFHIADLILQGKSGEIALNLRGKNTQLDGKVEGELDLSIIEFLSSTVTEASGAARLNTLIGGTIKEPQVNGKAEILGGTVRVQSVEAPFENITGNLELKQNVLNVQNLVADFATGRVTSRGNIFLFASQYPKLDLNATLFGNKIKVYPFQYVKVHGKINVKGEEIPYLVDGKIAVESALSREKVFSQNQSRVLKSARYMPSASLKDESDYPRFRLAIDVSGDQGIFVQNDLFDAELKANVKVINTIETPRLLGSVEVIPGQSKMTFKDRVFQIQSATVDFDNPAVLNPKFHLTAATDVNGVKVQIYSAGRLEKYKVELSSNPSMSESEILSLLALGLAPDEIKKLRSGDRDLYEQGEAASLILHSLDFNRDVQNKTGFQIQLDEAVNNQVGTSIFRPKSDSESVASPKIVIKRQIGRKIDLSVGRTVGAGNYSQNEFNAEWHVTPGLSIIGVYDDLKGNEERDSRTSLGVDLKLQRRFK